jgi:hypothetical protein
MLVDAVDFFNTNDQNEVRLPVVKYLASQRASSIQTLVTYLPHGGPPSFVPSDLPSTMPTGGLRPGIKCGAENRLVLLLLLLNRKPSSCDPL